MKYSITLTALVVVSLAYAAAAASPALGMWSWKQRAFETPEARAELLAFCDRQGISHIDQHISIKNGQVQNFEALEKLIAEAEARGITVNALRGDGTMFFENNHARTLKELKTIMAFNRTLPEQTRLAGVKFDVEPYLTPEWKAGGEERETVIRDYLSFLLSAKKKLKGSGLELSVDIPFWWDKPMYEIEFNGESKRFVHHIQDIVDWIGIMSYRRESRLVLKFVNEELTYAEKSNRPGSVAPGLETGKISGKEAFISFGGVPADQFRTVLSEIRSELSDNPHIRCIMLHHYDSLKTYLSSGNHDLIKGSNKNSFPQLPELSYRHGLTE